MLALVLDQTRGARAAIARVDDFRLNRQNCVSPVYAVVTIVVPDNALTLPHARERRLRFG